jgi:hypothetical protein
VYNYAMVAFGLHDNGVGKDFMREILENGVADPSSLANRQKDPAFARFAAAFNFAEHGAGATSFRPAVEGVTAKFTRQTLEENAGKENEGVRLALYFQRKAPDIDDFYEVLADPALSRVVRTALGLPDSFASADIDKQVALFERKLDLADFGDAKKLEKFLDRFTSLWELGSPSQGTVNPAAALIGRPVEFGVSGSLLLQIQSMRR